MARNVDAQPAKLLNQTPDFGSRAGDFLRNFGAADDDGRVLRQQAHDASEAHVSC